MSGWIFRMLWMCGLPKPLQQIVDYQQDSACFMVHCC